MDKQMTKGQIVSSLSSIAGLYEIGLITGNEKAILINDLRNGRPLDQNIMAKVERAATSSFEKDLIALLYY